MKILAPRTVLTLRYVERIMVRFDPMHARARNVREFMRTVSCDNLRASNRDVEIMVSRASDRSDPIISVSYQDGTAVDLGGSGFDSSQAINGIMAKTMEMDIGKVRSGKVEEEFTG